MLQNGEAFVFIVGCPRSGTTWLQRLLATHPYVRTGQESHVFSYIVPQLRLWRQQLEGTADGRGGVGLPCYMSQNEFDSLVREYTLKLLEPMIRDLDDGEIFVEKTPSHALFMTEIDNLLPHCRFIHVLRDPRDVCASLLAANKAWGKQWAPGSARDAASMWVSHVQAARAAGTRMPNNRYREVRYEELQKSPAATLNSLAKFLNLDWSIGEIEAAIEINSASQARLGGGTQIPLAGEARKRSGSVVKEPEGFIRQATAGSWKTDLSKMTKFQVWLVSRRLMNELGYK